MKARHSIWLTVFAAIVMALAGLTGASLARADLVSDHQLAGVLGSGEVYVAGEPGYEAGMWHHVTPAELATITTTGVGWLDVSWFAGSDASVLPGPIHLDPVAPAEPLQSDHQLAGLLTTGQVFVTGEPGYEEGMWHPVTSADLSTITGTGAGWFDIAWYLDELPGSIHIDEAT